jgi:hypothetical protein
MSTVETGDGELEVKSKVVDLKTVVNKWLDKLEASDNEASKGILKKLSLASEACQKVLDSKTFNMSQTKKVMWMCVMNIKAAKEQLATPA